LIPDLRETGYEWEDWMHVAQDKGPVAGCCEHSSEILVSVKGGEFVD